METSNIIRHAEGVIQKYCWRHFSCIFKYQWPKLLLTQVQRAGWALGVCASAELLSRSSCTLETNSEHIRIAGQILLLSDNRLLRDSSLHRKPGWFSVVPLYISLYHRVTWCGKHPAWSDLQTQSYVFHNQRGNPDSQEHPPHMILLPQAPSSWWCEIWSTREEGHEKREGCKWAAWTATGLATLHWLWHSPITSWPWILKFFTQLLYKYFCSHKAHTQFQFHISPVFPCDKVSLRSYCHKGKPCLRRGTQEFVCLLSWFLMYQQMLSCILLWQPNLLWKKLSVGKDTHGLSTAEVLLVPHSH